MNKALSQSLSFNEATGEHGRIKNVKLYIFWKKRTVNSRIELG